MESFPAMASAEQLLCALRLTPPRGGGAPSAIIDRVNEWKVMGESVLKGFVDCFSDIESREDNLRSISELLETRLGDLKENERELRWLHKGKKEELKLREEELRLREEKLDEQLRLVDEHIEKLEASQGEVDDLRMKERGRLKEIEKREKELEKRLGEFEKREKEFDALRDGKLRELAFKEEVLGKEKTEFVEEVRLANEKIKEKQKLGYELIERLELAVNMLGGMKVIMDERFKEIESREEVAHESLTTRLDEAELIRELLEKRFKELEGIEKELNLSQEDKTKEEQLGTVRSNEVELRGGKLTEQQKSGLQMLENKPEEKKQELELKQANLVSCRKEHDYEEHDSREKSPSCVRESTQTCAKENLALSKLDQPQRRTVGIDAHEGQQVCRPREVDLMEKLHDVHFKEHLSKQPMLTDTTDARLATKQDESVDWKHAMHKNLLVLLISGPEKDLKLMGRNMYKILSLSSDPAKLVVEAVEGFNALHSEILDTERRATILLLDQLTKLSPKIQPCVTEAAIELALGWKSKISTSVAAENPTEALAFLRLLAAYDLSSSFDKNELFSFLKLAEKHKHTRDLCHTFGLAEKIPDYIQELINEKQYLLASTYVYEYQLQHMFPQATILNYYASHSKFSANAQCRREHNSSAAQEKAIATEISALHLGIEHIIKYGLESEYSPNALTARIKQLEAPQTSFRRGIPFPSANIQKQGRCNGSQHLSKNARRRLRKEAKKSGVVALNPQIAPSHGSNNWSSFVWRRPPQHQSSQTKACPADLPYPQATVNLVPVPHPARPYKRPRTNAWVNKGGSHLGQFANNQC